MISALSTNLDFLIIYKLAAARTPSSEVCALMESNLYFLSITSIPVSHRHEVCYERVLAELSAFHSV